MDPPAEQISPFDRLPPEALDKILRNVRSLNELVKLRGVSPNFRRSVKRVLRATAVLDVNYISRGVTRFLLPRMRNLQIIPNINIDRDVCRSGGYFANAKYLAKQCPSIRFFYAASSEFILSYGEYLEQRKKTLEVKLVRVNYGSSDPIGIVALLNKYPHIEVLADALIHTFYKAIIPKPQVAAQIVTIVADKAIAIDRSIWKEVLEITTKLRSLTINLEVKNVGVIPALRPEVRHLRLKDDSPFDSSLLSGLILFITDYVATYQSFGLEIWWSNSLNDTSQIVEQLVKSRAKFLCGPEELEGTCLRLGSDWSVEVKPFRRRFTTHIKIWPADRVQWLYQLFPPVEYRPIRLYAISPLAKNGPFKPDIINAFLLPLADTRALHIELSSRDVESIGQLCSSLKDLRLRIVERDQELDLKRVKEFLLSKVAGYESFSLSIDGPVKDDDAKEIVKSLADLGANFRYTEHFGFPFLLIGDKWFISSCNILCIRRWPTDDIDLFLRLFRPTKRLHLAVPFASKAETSWENALNEFSVTNSLKKIPLDLLDLSPHSDEPAYTDR